MEAAGNSPIEAKYVKDRSRGKYNPKKDIKCYRSLWQQRLHEEGLQDAQERASRERWCQRHKMNEVIIIFEDGHVNLTSQDTCWIVHSGASFHGESSIHPINPKFMDNTEWSLGIYREIQNLKEKSCTWTKQVPPKTFIFLLYMNGGVWMCKKLIQAFDKSRSDNSNYRLKWCNHIYCESNYKKEYKVSLLDHIYCLVYLLALPDRSGYP